MKYYFRCPNCLSDEHFVVPAEQSSGLGCWLLVFGGLIPALLYLNADSRRIQCGDCGFIFPQPPFPRTPVSRLATWVIGIVVCFSFCILLMLMLPEIPSAISDAALYGVDKYVAKHAKAFVIGIVPMLLVLVAVAATASGVSNWRAHRTLKRQFETKPRAFSHDRSALAEYEPADADSVDAGESTTSQPTPRKGL